MKKIVLAAVASLVVGAPAVAADFAGPRVGVTVGILGDDIGSSALTTYGFEAGYDWDLGKTVIGVQGEYQDDFDGNNGHELAATARVGAKIGESALLYLAAGYSRFDVGPITLDGVRGGIGAEFALGGSGANLKVEQRYSNYELGVETYQTLVGIGYRF